MRWVARRASLTWHRRAMDPRPRTDCVRLRSLSAVTYSDRRHTKRCVSGVLLLILYGCRRPSPRLHPGEPIRKVEVPGEREAGRTNCLEHNAAFRIMPTETVVIRFFETFPGPLGSPLDKPARHNPDILSFGGTWRGACTFRFLTLRLGEQLAHEPTKRTLRTLSY
jgi:hypothetical protein